MNQKPDRRRRETRKSRPSKAAPSQRAPARAADEPTTAEQEPTQPATNTTNTARKAARTRAASTAPAPIAGNAESTLDRVMDQATHPGRFVTYVLLLAIVVVGWRYPQYIVDPTSAGAAARPVVAGMIAAVLFLSFSTLTLLAYSLLFGGATETNKKFLAAVLNRAGLGATLGTLLGVRLAPALLDPASGTPATFPEYLSDVGNTVTLLTLVLISTVWPYSLGPLVQAVVDSLERIKIRVPIRARRWAALPIALAVNGVGAALALAVFRALIQR